MALETQLELIAQQHKAAHPRAKRLRRAPRLRYPMGIEREYTRLVRSIVLPLFRDIADLVASRAKGIAEGVARDRETTDSIDDIGDLENLFESINIITEQRLEKADIRNASRRVGAGVDSHARKQVGKTIKAVSGINPMFATSTAAQELQLFSVTNTNLITSMVKQQQQKLQTEILVDFQSGLRAEDISKRIQGRLKDSVTNAKARANLIARDQVSKLNGQLMQLRQKEIGVKSYTWRTVGDGAVRDSHAELDGKTFSWDEPPSVGHPGDDYQCRCTAEPNLAEIFKIGE